MAGQNRRAQRAQMALVLGGAVGGGIGVLLNYFLYAAFGADYPVGPTSFGLFALGAFGGMALSEKLGKRALKIMAIAAGILVSLAAMLAFLLSG